MTVRAVLFQLRIKILRFQIYVQILVEASYMYSDRLIRESNVFDKCRFSAGLIKGLSAVKAAFSALLDENDL